MTYRFNMDYSYCVNLQSIQLFDRQGKNALTLNYPDAAIFDLLMKQYSQKTMIRVISKIALVTESHADSLIHDTMDFLLQQNVLLPEQKHG